MPHLQTGDRLCPTRGKCSFKPFYLVPNLNCLTSNSSQLLTLQEKVKRGHLLDLSEALATDVNENGKDSASKESSHERILMETVRHLPLQLQAPLWKNALHHGSFRLT